MPNIQQQKKRVRIASRQRLENLRYRSSVKTLQRRVSDAIADGKAEEISSRPTPYASLRGMAREPL